MLDLVQSLMGFITSYSRSSRVLLMGETALMVASGTDLLT